MRAYLDMAQLDKGRKIDPEVRRIVDDAETAAALAAVWRSSEPAGTTVGAVRSEGATLNSKQAAQRLGVGTRAITKRAHALGGWKQAGAWRFDAALIDRERMAA